MYEENAKGSKLAGILLASGSSIALSQNAYARAYSGVDVLTIMSTEKDIKKHVYENVKDLYDKTKY